MGGSSGPKWNSLLRKRPLWLITFCWTDILRLKYLDTSVVSQVELASKCVCVGGGGAVTPPKSPLPTGLHV